MNKKMLFLIFGIVFSFCIISCSIEEDSQVSETYLNVAMSSQPTTLDPSKSIGSYAGEVMQNILEPLIRVNEDEGGNTYFVPAGAETWEVSEDELVYTFHLRDNKWNDGKTVTSKDYAYGIRRSADPKTACKSANFLFYLKNGKDVVEGKKPVEELGVSTPDDKTLVLTLDVSVPYFLSICSQRTYFPQRKDLVEKYGEKYSSSPEMTPQCGPFILLDWVINSQMNFVKNENYWNFINVALDSVNCKIIADDNTIYNALLAGEIDFAAVSDPNWRYKFEANEEFIYEVQTLSGTTFVMFNSDKGQITSNPKIRQAMSVAIDREEYIKTCKDGLGTPSYSFIPTSISCQGQQFSYEGEGPVADLIEANPDPRALFIEGLKELGINKAPEEIKIEYMVSGTDKKARTETEFIQQIMKDKIGINIKILMVEWSEFLTRLGSKSYEAARLSWGADFDDPINFFEVAWPPAGILDSGWNHAEYNECVANAKVEINPEKRYKIFKRADEILCKEEAEYLPIMSRASYAFHKKFIKHIPLSGFNTMGWQVIDTQDRP